LPYFLLILKHNFLAGDMLPGIEQTDDPSSHFLTQIIRVIGIEFFVVHLGALSNHIGDSFQILSILRNSPRFDEAIAEFTERS
jgi:hypothetical protein